MTTGLRFGAGNGRSMGYKCACIKDLEKAAPYGLAQQPLPRTLLAKGRFAAYLESVTIRVITHNGPGLLGAAMSLRAHDSNTHSERAP